MAFFSSLFFWLDLGFRSWTEWCKDSYFWKKNQLFAFKRKGFRFLLNMLKLIFTLIQAWEQWYSQGNWTEWVLRAILREVHKGFKEILELTWQSFHSGCIMSCNPNAWKCQLPTALALRSYFTSRMVLFLLIWTLETALGGLWSGEACPQKPLG